VRRKSFGDLFLLILGLFLKAPALLSSLRYAKRPSGGLRVWTVSALRRLSMEEPLPARRALQPSSLTTHLTRKARQAARFNHLQSREQKAAEPEQYSALRRLQRIVFLSHSQVQTSL